MSKTRDNQDTPRNPADERVNESQKRGGYIAPNTPFNLPTMPAGPGQGGQKEGESTPPASTKD